MVSFFYSSLLVYYIQDFQFVPPELAKPHEREMAVHKVGIAFARLRNQSSWLQRLNEIPAASREPQGPKDTPEKLEEERLAAQHFIDTGM
jgi:SWI/SNF-related matrix-associated actin-dependent regulator of chromatin subfamily A member 5